jgi:hypothetical protein
MQDSNHLNPKFDFYRTTSRQRMYMANTEEWRRKCYFSGIWFGKLANKKVTWMREFLSALKKSVKRSSHSAIDRPPLCPSYYRFPPAAHNQLSQWSSESDHCSVSHLEASSLTRGRVCAVSSVLIFVMCTYLTVYIGNKSLLKMLLVHKGSFTSKLDLNLRKKLVKCYIWSIAL